MIFPAVLINFPHSKVCRLRGNWSIASNQRCIIIYDSRSKCQHKLSNPMKILRDAFLFCAFNLFSDVDKIKHCIYWLFFPYCFNYSNSVYFCFTEVTLHFITKLKIQCSARSVLTTNIYLYFLYTCI